MALFAVLQREETHPLKKKAEYKLVCLAAAA